MAPHFHGIMVYPLSEPTKESDFSKEAHFQYKLIFILSSFLDDQNASWKICKKVKLGSVIGSGGFGKVHRAVINPAGRASYEAAVKIPHHQGDNDLKQEALIFNLLQHTNILRFESFLF